jgi:predicted exporter
MDGYKMKKRLKILIFTLVALSLVGGFLGLRIDVDVFSLLPKDSFMVDGLKLYQRSFGSSQDLIISLRSQDAELTARAARSLAKRLEDSGLASQVIWRNPIGNDPALLGDLLAYLWFNQPNEDFQRLARKLEDGQLESTLASSLERLATSLSPVEVALLGYDPFAITDLPDQITSPLKQWADDPFASPKGDFRILLVQPPFEKVGFWKFRKWVAQLTDLSDSFMAENDFGDSLTVRLTGNPVFMAEAGSGFMRDFVLAALGTLILVSALFWLVYRNWIPLLWLTILLVLILLITVAIGSMFFGTLNAVSLGFAAILMGLAGDYALILFQEYRANPKRSFSEHRRLVAPGIIWAALTTAGAFLIIGRSSLPGLTQLGTLVGIGILVAAAVMLLAFLPPLARSGPLNRPINHVGKPWFFRKVEQHPRFLWVGTLLVVALSAAMLVTRLPRVDAGTKNLGPKQGLAMAAFNEVQREIGGYDEALWLIISGIDEHDVSERLAASRRVLDEWVQNGVLSGYTLPVAVWPRPENQLENQAVAGWLASRLSAAKAAALTVGFKEDSLRLTEEVFFAWKRFAAADGVVWPNHEGSEWLFRQFAGRDSGRLLTLGRVEASATTIQGDLLKLTDKLFSDTGAQMIGWSLMSESLMEIMKRDLRRVLIPMGIVMLILLGMAFRGFKGITLCLATLGFSSLCLLGFMGLMGWSWNLMNVMALPLLFGAGIDYSIHIQFALRRNGGDMSRSFQTVGRAILLCGASTAAGFASLGFATNAGLASLGRVCAVGIMITCLVSVYLLPLWWRFLGGISMVRAREGVS